jgi:hypothetical protein
VMVKLDGHPLLDGWADFHSTRALVLIGQSPFEEAFGKAFTGQFLKIEHPLLFAEGSPSRWDAAAYGPLELNLTFAPAPDGSIEPLLMAGMKNQGQALVLQRLPLRQARAGWLAYGGDITWGQPFPLPEGGPIRLLVKWGALLPPLGSSLWPATETGASGLKASLSVEMGNLEILHLAVAPFDPAPATVVARENSLQLSNVAMRLQGEVVASKRLPWR